MTTRRYIFFIFCFSFLFNQTILAQRKVKITPQTPICALVGDTTTQDRFVDKASAQIRRIVDDICTKKGVNATRFIVEAANVPNAEALILDGKRYIHYNPLYISAIQKESQTYWAMIFVLAHEIGHHANFDTMTKADADKCQEEELGADKFAGCALRHLGATAEEIEKAISFLPTEGGTLHPPRSARLMFAKIGWENCAPPKQEDKRNDNQDDNKSKENQEKTTNKPCSQNNTGSIVFRNLTRTTLQIIVINGNEYDYRGRTAIDLSANETLGFYDLPAKTTSFKIKKLDGASDALGNGGGMLLDYKTVQYPIRQCAENPKPIDIL